MVDKQKRKALSMEIAQRLADMRREKGFSQEELANRLGLSRQAISKWERGESAPDMANLIALADLYNVTLDELIRGEVPAASAAEAETNAKTSAADKVDVTINTFINDEKPKAASASAPAAEQSSATTATATAPTAAAGAPAGAAAPSQACPPPPQAQPVYQVITQPQPQPEAPKVTNEVWMTFPYPLFCALLYLVLGFVFGLWHPGWIIFLTIPFFYWIVRVVKQDPNYIATHTPGASGAQLGNQSGEVKQP